MNSFRKQRLAVLSGLATEVCQSEWGEAQVEHPKAMKNPRVTAGPYAPFAFAAVHIKVSRRRRAQSSPPRHRTPARWRRLAPRPSQHGRVVAEK